MGRFYGSEKEMLAEDKSMGYQKGMSYSCSDFVHGIYVSISKGVDIKKERHKMETYIKFN